VVGRAGRDLYPKLCIEPDYILPQNSTYAGVVQETGTNCLYPQEKAHPWSTKLPENLPVEEVVAEPEEIKTGPIRLISHAFRGPAPDAEVRVIAPFVD